MADNGTNVGTVEQVTGVVIDVVFPDHIPEIYSALGSRSRRRRAAPSST